MSFEIDRKYLEGKPQYILDILEILKREKVINSGRKGIKINSHYGKEKGNEFFQKCSQIIPYLEKFPDLTSFLICFNQDLNEIPKCIVCGENAAISSLDTPYFLRTCGKKECVEKAPFITNKERNGGVLYVQTEEAKRKNKEYFLRTYGVESPSQLEEIKEKKKQTVMKNFGVSYPAQDPEIHRKQKESYIRKHGGIGFASPSVLQKVLETNLKRYGVEKPS